MAATAIKNATFIWEGTDKQGRKSKGEIQSRNQALAKAELRKQGVNPTRVKRKGQDLFSFGASTQKILPMDIAIFTRQLATMMKAGVPLIQAFDIVAEGLSNPSMKTLVLSVKNDVASGNSFASCLRRQPTYFDTLYCDLVDAGEQSGALETMLDRVAMYKEKTEALKAKIRSAMKYPIAVIAIAFIVSAILLVKVVPMFESLFHGFGAELPAFTQMVVGMSEFMQEWWYIIGGGAAVLGVTISEVNKRSQAFRDAVERLSLQAPVVGDIINKSAIARFARTLSTTFAAGVPLVDSLQSCAGASGNIVYYNALIRVKEDVSTGQSLYNSLKATDQFPSMVLQMISIGEESGALDEMLDKVATFYEDEVDVAVDGLTSLMEPLIMAVLGVLIGGLIIAMYLPIFAMGSVV